MFSKFSKLIGSSIFFYDAYFSTTYFFYGAGYAGGSTATLATSGLGGATFSDGYFLGAGAAFFSTLVSIFAGSDCFLASAVAGYALDATAFLVAGFLVAAADFF